MLKIGQSGSFSKVITEKDIRVYADIVGDTNPIHLSNEAARSRGFEKQVVHGMLTGSLISTVMGTIFPGEGTVYLEQNLKFINPVYEGERVTATVIVTEILKPEKGIYRLYTSVESEAGKNLIEGYAVVKYKETV